MFLNKIHFFAHSVILRRAAVSFFVLPYFSYLNWVFFKNQSCGFAVEFWWKCLSKLFDFIRLDYHLYNVFPPTTYCFLFSQKKSWKKLKFQVFHALKKILVKLVLWTSIMNKLYLVYLYEQGLQTTPINKLNEQALSKSFMSIL